MGPGYSVTECGPGLMPSRVRLLNRKTQISAAAFLVRNPYFSCFRFDRLNFTAHPRPAVVLQLGRSWAAAHGSWKREVDVRSLRIGTNIVNNPGPMRSFARLPSLEY